jgi:glycine rich protein
MRRPLAKLTYVGLLVVGILAGSVFHVLGSSTPTVFNACLTTGGTLIEVSTQTGARSCPDGSVPVSWNQQGPPGPAGGMSQILEITASTTFAVPAGVTRLMVEAWGGGGGGGNFDLTTCLTGGGGGSGGYLRSVLAVTPGESLSIVVGNGGTPGSAGTASAVIRGSSRVVSAGGGAAGTTSGGAGGQTITAAGLARTGNVGGSGQLDSMCQFGFGGGTVLGPVGQGGAPVQGSVVTLASASAGGSGSSSFQTAQPGANGEFILSW